MSELQTVLEDMGVDIKRQTGDELQGRCPVHALYKGRESSRYSWYINIDTGLWQCFTCHARGNLPILVSSLTNDPHAIMSVHKYMASAGLERIRNKGEEPEEQEVEADWKVYASFDKVPDLLLRNRGLDPLVAARYGIRFNKREELLPDGKQRPDYKCWIVPVLSLTGNLLGWQAKQGKYFANIPTGVHKSESLFGFTYAPRGSAALLVESPLDVVRFHSAYQDTDVFAVASYGASVSDFQIGALKAHFDKLILGLDNDKAGVLESNRLRGRTRQSNKDLLTGFRQRVWYLHYGHTTAKDIGDMTDEEINVAVQLASRIPS